MYFMEWSSAIVPVILKFEPLTVGFFMSVVPGELRIKIGSVLSMSIVMAPVPELLPEASRATASRVYFPSGISQPL